MFWLTSQEGHCCVGLINLLVNVCQGFGWMNYLHFRCLLCASKTVMTTYQNVLWNNNMNWSKWFPCLCFHIDREYRATWM
jgi:hypothetical protein